jgi:hypothetical protein
MKRRLLHFGIVGTVALSCFIVWRAMASGHAAQAAVHREDISVSKYPHWVVQQGSGDENGHGRIELFEETGECGYIERLSKEFSPRFLVYLMEQEGGARKGLPSSHQNPVLISAFDNLETAMRTTEHYCKSK